MSEVQAEAAKPVSMRTIVAASSAGTAFEWYDFFVFGTLAAIISKNFFAGAQRDRGLHLRPRRLRGRLRLPPARAR